MIEFDTDIAELKDIDKKYKAVIIKKDLVEYTTYSFTKHQIEHLAKYFGWKAINLKNN